MICYCEVFKYAQNCGGINKLFRHCCITESKLAETQTLSKVEKCTTLERIVVER